MRSVRLLILETRFNPTVNAQPPIRDVEHDPEFEHYLVRARNDILPVLRSLAERHAPLEVRLEGNPAVFKTRLLRVKAEYEELFFDASGIPGADTFDGSQRLQAEAMLDAVRIVFDANLLESVALRGQAGFRGRLPSVLARIQRRGSVRYPVPSRNPPVCSVALPPSGVVHHFRIIDISLSGVALVVEGAKLPIEAGTNLHEARIEIPDVGPVATGLQVTYASQPDSAGWRRVGCRFDDLPITGLAHIRRYVAHLERAALTQP